MSSAIKSDAFVSIILDFQEVTDAKLLKLSQIQKLLSKSFIDFEIIVITQGAFFDRKSQDKVAVLIEELTSIRQIHLSGFVDGEICFAAGVENAVGDYIVLFNIDTDPLKAIIHVVEKCMAGTDVVIGVAEKQTSLLYSVLRLPASWILKGISYTLPKNATDLRCLSRQAINSLTRSGKYRHQFYMRIQKLAYNYDIYQYSFDISQNSKVGILKASRSFLSIVVFNSTKPLRWMSGVGAVGSFMAFIFALYSLLSHLWRGHVAEGWTTIILFVSLLFMIQFVILAFLGEYLARVLDERSDGVDYSILFEKNSPCMINENRLNVLSGSA